VRVVYDIQWQIVRFGVVSDQRALGEHGSVYPNVLALAEQPGESSRQVPLTPLEMPLPMLVPRLVDIAQRRINVCRASLVRMIPREAYFVISITSSTVIPIWYAITSND
jgi:hypothetical protein